jgi:hypothetical protein
MSLADFFKEKLNEPEYTAKQLEEFTRQSKTILTMIAAVLKKSTKNKEDFLVTGYHEKAIQDAVYALNGSGYSAELRYEIRKFRKSVPSGMPGRGEPDDVIEFEEPAPVIYVTKRT